MIVDTSAVVAVLLAEPWASVVERALRDPERGRLRMAAPTYLELGIVIDRRGAAVLSRRLDDLLAELEVEIVAFDHELVDVARRAYVRFGRGSGHPARLNFGDCFSYALASARREPLLFVGDDFGHTDITSAI